MQNSAPAERQGSRAANPYRSSSYADPPGFARTRISKVRVLVWAYPLLMVATFYGTWLVAWLMLGHPPRPMRNDPKSISIVVDVPYFMTNLMIVAMPATWIGGILIELTVRASSYPRRLALCLAYVLLWIATICFIRWDPLLVTQWLGD